MVGEGRPTPGVGRGVSCTLGEEGLDGVWKRRAEEEEVGWRARGQTGVTYSVPAAGRRRARSSGAAGKPGLGLPALRRRAGAAQWWAPMIAFRNEGCSERKQYQTISK